jgi:hypothetical protein
MLTVRAFIWGTILFRRVEYDGVVEVEHSTVNVKAPRLCPSSLDRPPP